MDNLDTGVLLIGLGGTGGEVLRIIKKRMENSPYRDYVAYYYLDSRARAHEGFQPGEYRHIGGFRVSKILKEHKRNIQNWWYHDKYAPDFDTQDGAGQTRLIGRLCYYLNAENIKREIDNIITSKLRGPKLDVIVISSSGGGTGSGFFIDIGFLLRQLIGERKRAFYVGVLLDPSIVRDRIAPDTHAKRQTEINGLAFLTELEFYMGMNAPYNFNLFYEGKVQSITESEIKPFDFIFALQIENRKGYHFSHKEDYFSLQAEGIWHLINISFRFLAERGSGLENYFKEIVESPKCDGKTQFYASFGSASIFFPFKKVYDYCSEKYCGLILSNLLQDIHPEEFKLIADDVSKFILDNNLKESSNSDQLIRYCRKLFYDDVNKQWHFNSTEMLNSISNKLDKAEKNFQDVLNNLEKTLSQDLKSFDTFLNNALNERHQEISENLKNYIDSLLREAKWKRAYNFLKTLKEAIEFELNDLIKNEEEGWLRKRNSQSISQMINQLVNQINEQYNQPFIKILFKSSRIKNEIKYLKSQLAKKWTDEYFNFHFYNHILRHLKKFYQKLIDEVSNHIDNLEKAIQEFENFRKGLRVKGILNSRIDVPGHKIGVDFIFEICSSEEIVDKMIYTKFDDQCLKEDIKRLALNPSINFLKELVRETTDKLLYDLSLDLAFKLEAEYFWSKSKQNLKDNFSIGLPRQKDELIDELKNIFGIDTLRKLKNQIESNKQTNDHEVLKELVKGRIECLLDWAKPFWQWRQAIPGIASPFIFSIYHINNRNTMTLNILEELGPYIAPDQYIKTTSFDLDDPYSLLFFQIEGKQPLFNLLPIYNLKKAEQERQRIISLYRTNRKIPNPDQIGYSDKIFIFQQPYRDFSIFPMESEEKTFLVFSLSELFGFIRPLSSRRKDFTLQSQLSLEFGISDSCIGRSLKDSLDFLNRSPDILAALENKCNEKINEYNVKDRHGLISLFKQQLQLYAKLKSNYCQRGTQNSPLCQIYTYLYNILYNFAKDNNLI